MFYPDTHDYNKLIDLGLTKDEFLDLQIKYKHGFEEYLKTIIDFNEINSYILMSGNLHKIEDEDRNFYKKYSSLGSDFFYLRNNIHIERLDVYELGTLKGNPDKDFYEKTYEKVLFETEKDTNIFIGTAVPTNEVKGRSLIFEFAHDMRKESSVERYAASNISKYIKDLLNKYSESRNIPISFLEYKAIPDYFL